MLIDQLTTSSPKLLTFQHNQSFCRNYTWLCIQVVLFAMSTLYRIEAFVSTLSKIVY